MAVDFESFLYSCQKLLVVIDFQIGVDTALHENSGSAKGEGFFDLLVNDMFRQNIGFRIALDAIERAERAELPADIRVIDIPVDDIADDIIRMKPFPDSITYSSSA